MTEIPKLISAEGWHVLHLFYKVEHGQWAMLDNGDKMQARTNLSDLIEEIRNTEGCQILTFSMMTKADLGFMLLCADLQLANYFEKRLTLSLGPDVLVPTYSFYSMTERSEYTSTEAEYIAELKAEKGLTTGPEFDKALGEWRTRIEHYLQHRLYPVLPPWEVMCFYPMIKRRGAEGQNWYALPHEKRKELMGGHARVGRKWAGKILQLITGCTGLDDWEWGVTLLAHDPMDLKGIVYEMRFDEVTAQYAEFGEFYVGLQLPVEAIFRRLML